MATSACEIGPRQAAIGPGAAEQREERVLLPFARRHLGDDLLRQHVERRARDRRAGRARRARTLSSSAAHSTSSSRDSGKSRPLGVPPTAVAGAADALQEAGDRARRADLADEVDLADIDAELERGGRDQRLQLPRLEALLGVEPQLLGEAAVMRRERAVAEPLGELRASRAPPAGAC
jgi:hypothetical protein